MTKETDNENPDTSMVFTSPEARDKFIAFISCDADDTTPCTCPKD